MGLGTAATLRSVPMHDRSRRLLIARTRGPGAALSRRTFLAGAAASTLLVACGDGSGDRSATDAPADGGELSVVRVFGPYFTAGALARVPIGLADADGILPASSAPREIEVDVVAPDGSVVAEGLVSPLYHDGLARPYYAFEFTPETEGFYDFTVDTGDVQLTSQLQVVPADHPVAGALLQPGQPMPAVETPTFDDPRGVDPICTRTPPCDLHRTTVAEAAGAGPMVLLVSTPAFCQIDVCGPVLDVVLGLVPDHPEITFIHAEVYVDPEANQNPPVASDFAPVIEALGLPFEPALFAVGADGVVRERLDYLFDAVELGGVLDRLG